MLDYNVKLVLSIIPRNMDKKPEGLEDLLRDFSMEQLEEMILISRIIRAATENSYEHKHLYYNLGTLITTCKIIAMYRYKVDLW